MKQSKLILLIRGIVLLYGLSLFGELNAFAMEQQKGSGNLKQPQEIATNTATHAETSVTPKEVGTVEEKEALKKICPKKICPRCGSNKTAQILFGKPMFSDELRVKLDNKEIILGGCMISLNDPTHHCFACEKDFGNRNK